ncbi:ATP-binding protein [Aneurinibacillus uraniidurans]|uniref:ATP-binding protein n=1 Tax=Aneurinibacillus uraniidurans TaxID=2966586 RepID=UPI0023496D75|nr:ATP-binding protein [Aneurinibacillus sp. B1]WCN36271.1 ATP-binding protein [Aneurinibacillus sp. B1]
MIGIRALLLNTLIIIASILLYQVSWSDKRKSEVHNTLFISLLAAIAVVLCMTFPFRFFEGYIYDLRFIPIFLSLFYGGYRSLFFVSIVYMGYRYYLGGVGFYASVTVYGIFIPLLIFLKAFYAVYFRRGKIIFGVLFSLSYSVTFSAFAIWDQIHKVNTVTNTLLEFTSIYIVINMLTMWISIYLIEEMIQNKRIRQEIQRAEKMYIVGELAAAMAHEIRNPITVIQGFTQLFIKNQIPENKRAEYLQLVVEELGRVELIITEYLSLAKPEKEAKTQIEMGELVREVIMIIEPFGLLKNVEIQSAVPSPLYLSADPVKIKQCLINIMKNGIEAIEGNGVLRIHVEKKNNDLVIEIHDTGIGMTPEETSQLGMPFYSTKKKGTGLGTMISYRIVEGLNGRINVTSEKGKGTCFSIILPASHEDELLC